MAVDHNNPQSRDEEILIATIDGTEYNKLPQSRMEELLLELKEVIEAGSGGGGIHPIGVTTTPLYDGATTNPIQINGESYTAETGDMVTYQSTEFLFNVNEVWQELGDVSEVLEIIDDIFADIAPAFDSTSTYAVGDYVIYNDLLYRCTTAHTGAWAAADFTATNLSDEIKNNKGTEYTAGKYINIDTNNEIKVNPVVPNEAFTYTIKQIDDYSFEIIKTVDNVVVFDEVYSCYDPVAQQQIDVNETFDDAINIHIYPAGERSYTLLIASDAHEAGFKQTTPWWQRNTFVENFSTVDHSGEKLIVKSELDTALTSKQNVTDNTLQTTDKTVVGAVNELKSGLTNYQAQNDLNLEVPNRKNLFIGIYGANSTTVYSPVKPSTKYTISTKSTGASQINIQYIYTDDTIGGNAALCPSGATSNSITVTTPSNAKGIEIYAVADASAQSYASETQIELGSTATAYTPYIPSVESRIEAVESGVARLVCTEIVYDDSASLFTLPSGVPKPKDGAQIMVCGRNRSTGAIYALWFDNSASGFKIGKILDGSAPADGISISVQYIG